MNALHRNLLITGMLLTGGLSSCTKNFEQLNTNPAELTNAQTLAILSTVFGVMEQSIYADYQTAQNLSADAYAGYMMSQTYFNGGQNDANYFMVDSWNVNGFKDQYNQVMSDVSKLSAAGLRNSPDEWAVALVVQVEAMDRVTDRFGPIPYSKAGTSLISVPYDSQDSVYTLFFRQLDTAVSNLETYVAAHPGEKPLASADLIYAGNYVEWIKYANSLRLRLAMRIVKADPTTAEAQAEKALSDPGGLLTAPGDDALFQQSGTRNNDVWLVTASYKNNAMGGALVAYMNGYKDPRLPKYASPATDPLVDSGTYIGIRIGINVGSAGTEYAGFSWPNTDSTFTQTAPQYLMTAAEVWFLKAEAALRGWAGAGTAEADYNEGIATSFQQWNVSSATYATDNTSAEQPYVDPHNSANNDATDVSTTTIAYNAAGTQEQQLAQIITQKWIAMYPDGQEAWADYRRTGYPTLFPVVINNSAGLISTTTQIRRLPYPSIEYTNDATAVNAAVQNLLGGADNGGTRVWWDVNKGNF